MFVGISTRRKTVLRWATPLLFVALWLAYVLGALLQVVFAYSGPAFGAVAWPAHIAGFVFGVLFALLTRAAIARRLRRSRGY